MADKTKPCLISCSVLKDELQKLIKQGELDVNVVFVSKYFHVDFSLIEQNLRQIIPQNLPRFPAGVILVYGDLCLGMNNEMKQLAEEYGIVKVDALNCTDCLFGGKSQSLEADPNHELLVLNPGLIGFFHNVRETAKAENVDDETLKQLFSGVKGIVLLDTVGEADKNKAAIEQLNTGLKILETKPIGLEKLTQLLQEALKQNAEKQATPALGGSEKTQKGAT